MSGSGRRAPAALLAIPAVLTLGGISCINTWDVPTCAVLLGAAFVLKAYAHRVVPVGARRGAVGAPWR